MTSSARKRVNKALAFHGIFVVFLLIFFWTKDIVIYKEEPPDPPMFTAKNFPVNVPPPPLPSKYAELKLVPNIPPPQPTPFDH